MAFSLFCVVYVLKEAGGLQQEGAMCEGRHTSCIAGRNGHGTSEEL